MALKIRSAEVERLVTEIRELTGETETEAVRRSLADRKDSLCRRGAERDRFRAVLRFLETEVWPLVPADELGRSLDKDQQEGLVGMDTKES